MIKPICDKCHKEQDEFGAILWSEPKEVGQPRMMCDKWHLCIDCYNLLLELIKQLI